MCFSDHSLSTTNAPIAHTGLKNVNLMKWISLYLDCFELCLPSRRKRCFSQNDVLISDSIHKYLV